MRGFCLVADKDSVCRSDFSPTILFPRDVGLKSDLQFGGMPLEEERQCPGN